MKTDFTLLPPNAIKLVAELLTKGLEKYPDEKWRRLSINDHLAAALRHINAYLRGEALDEDSPSHLINAATRLLFATELEALASDKPVEYDSIWDAVTIDPNEAKHLREQGEKLLGMRNRYQSLQDDYRPYDYRTEYYSCNFNEHSYPPSGEAIKPGGTD